jgi:hypothetical protein
MMTTVIDQASLIVVVVGLLVTAALFATLASDWFRSHDPRDKREAIRAAVQPLLGLETP